MTIDRDIGKGLVAGVTAGMMSGEAVRGQRTLG